MILRNTLPALTDRNDSKWIVRVVTVATKKKDANMVRKVWLRTASSPFHECGLLDGEGHTSERKLTQGAKLSL